ncbi:hypothetical protein V5H98_06740 [Georgenia sp. M64]|uniref:hypothetical protein n=1 Tax=Georgenia sp. M64 TaxID=3120520 RepID=UPI0030E1F211
MSMTPERAGEWRTAIPSRRWAVVLVVAWSAAFALSVVTDTVPCSPADPSVCGPDTGFAVFVVPLLATPLLLLLRPALGAAAGVVFAVGDVALDDHLPANVAFGLVGAGCAMYLWRILRGRRRQRLLTGGTRVPGPVSEQPEPDSWDLVRVGAAVLLLLGALGLAGWYARSVAVEEDRLARSVVVDGEVVAVDDVDYLLDVALGDGGARRTVTVPVLEPTDHTVGASVPVLLDPAAPDRSTLVAEPPDHTGWLSAALGAATAAALLLVAEVRRRRAVRELWVGAAHRTEVVLLPDGSGSVLLLPVGGAGGSGGRHALRPLGRVPVAFAVPRASDDSAVDAGGEPDADGEPDTDGATYADGPGPDDELDLETTRRLEAEAVALFGQVWRDEVHWTAMLDDDDLAGLEVPVEQSATVVGSLHEGGYVLVVTEDEVLVPDGPVRPTTDGGWQERGAAAGRGALDALRRTFTGADADGDAVVPADPAPIPEEGPPGHAVAPGPVTGTVVVGTTQARRAVGVALVVAGLLGGPAWVRWMTEGDWFQALSAAFAAVTVLLAGTRRALTEVRGETSGLTVVTGMWRYQVPWSSFHGVRRDGTGLWLAWEPFTEVELPAVTGGTDDGRRAEDLARALAGLAAHSRRAVEADAAVRPAPGPAVRREPGPALALLVLLVVGVAAAWWA